MKKFILAFIILLCCILSLSPKAMTNLITVEFSDTVWFWPGWQYSPTKDQIDSVGIPDLLGFNSGGGKAIISDKGFLKELRMEYSGNSNIWWVLFPGDLFIDKDADSEWDYLIKIFDPLGKGYEPGINNMKQMGSDTDGDGKYNLEPGAFKVYDIDGQFLKDSSTDCNYIKSGSDNSGGWSGYNIRDQHPIGLKVDDIPLYQIWFSGWESSNPVNSKRTAIFKFDYDGNNYFDSQIALSDEFIIGWGVNCANDVIYERIKNPVPESCTFLFLGLGFIALLGLVNKKKFDSLVKSRICKDIV
ncbi:hypothetical protein JXL19_06705 [bacterium]|nr:hypothetical protein [bacterium]